MDGLHEYEVRTHSAVGICHKVVSRLLKHFSVGHRDSNSNDSEVALSNLLKTYKTELPSFHFPSSKAYIYDDDGKINDKIAIDKLDVGIICDIMKSVPRFSTETLKNRKKRLPHMDIDCIGNSHNPPCCDTCSHLCKKCSKTKCGKQCCDKSGTCNHLCNNCNVKKEACENDYIACCNLCKLCKSCQLQPCENYLLRESIETIKKLRNVSAHTVHKEWELFEVGQGSIPGFSEFANWIDLRRHIRSKFRFVVSYLVRSNCIDDEEMDELNSDMEVALKKPIGIVHSVFNNFIQHFVKIKVEQMEKFEILNQTIKDVSSDLSKKMDISCKELEKTIEEHNKSSDEKLCVISDKLDKNADQLKSKIDEKMDKDEQKFEIMNQNIKDVSSDVSTKMDMACKELKKTIEEHDRSTNEKLCVIADKVDQNAVQLESKIDDIAEIIDKVNVDLKSLSAEDDVMKLSNIFVEKYEEFDHVPLPWNKNKSFDLLNFFIKIKFRYMDSNSLALPKLFEIIERKKLKRIAVIAHGGMGKTILGKYLCHRWAGFVKFRKLHQNSVHDWDWFSRFDNVIHLDVKDIKGNSADDIYDAILRLTGEHLITGEARTKLHKTLQKKQEETFFILDSFDEASFESKEAVNLFFGKTSIFMKSVVMVLSRQDGEEDLDGINIARVEIKKLHSKQSRNFIRRQYCFDSKDSQKKLLNDRNSKLKSDLLCYPIYLIMLCGLYDDPALNTPLNDELDIYLAVVALVIKTEKLKGDKSLQLRKEWNRKTALEIIQEKQDILSAFGYAIYKCNGDCFTKYDRLSEADVIKHMERILGNSSEVKEEINSCLRWGFLDRSVKINTECTKSVIRFTHRNFRDIVISFFLKSRIDIAEEKKLDVGEPLVVRYALDMIRKKEVLDADELDTVISLWEKAEEFNEVFLAYLLLCYVEFITARERIRSSIIKFVTSYVKKYKLKGNVASAAETHRTSFFLSCTFKLTETNGGTIALTKGSLDYLDNFLKALVDHAKPEKCTQCVLPRKLGFCFKKDVYPVYPRTYDNDKDRDNVTEVIYSEEKCYGIFPLLKLEQKHKLCILVLPRPGENHISISSQYAHFNADKLKLKMLRKSGCLAE